MEKQTEESQKTITETAEQRLENLIDRAPGISQMRKSQVLAGIAGTAGLVIFARGIEMFIEHTLGISSPLTEIGIGLILLILSGLLFKKLL